jgi:hypothetical protein
MPTKYENETDTNNPAERDYQDKFNRESSDTENSPVDEKEGLATAESNSEKKSKDASSDNPELDNEKSWYKENFGEQNESLAGRIQTSFNLASKRKKALGAGGILAIILSVFAFFSFLSAFQLIHLTEMLDGVFDKQTQRVMSKRAAKHYAIALDEDGKSYYKKTGLSGRLAKGYGSLDPNDLKNNLKAKGYDIGLTDTGKFTINGVEVNGKLDNQRNQLASILREQYPDDGFMKRNARTRTAFKAMGIQRTFFLENSKRTAQTWQLEMIKRIRERLGVTNSTSRITTGTSEDSANNDVSNQADDLAERTLSDPTFDPAAGPVADPDININPNDIYGGVVTGAANTAKLDGVLAAACEVKYYIKGVELTAVVLRHQALVENAGMILVAGHQLKTGKGVTSAQVGALMGLLNKDPGIGASGSYQLMSGKKGAKVTTAEDFTLDFSKTGGTSGTISDINKKVDDALRAGTGGLGNNYCGLSRNIFYAIGSGVVGIVVQVGGTIVSGGTLTPIFALKAGASLAFQVALQQAKTILQPILARNLAGPAVTLAYGASQGGDKSFDALAGGALAISSASRYQGGMTQKLTGAQVAEIETAIAKEETEESKTQSIYAKYFDVSNEDSALAKQLAVFPSTPKAASTAALNNVGSLPGVFLKSLSLFTPNGNAKAAEVTSGNPYLEENPLGIPMYGMTDETIDGINDDVSYDPVENENWIYSNGGLEGYQSWVTSCYPVDDPAMLYGLAVDEDQEKKLNEECTNVSEEKYKRYATYRLDRGIQQGLLFMSELSDCTDPDSEDYNCTDEAAQSPTTPSGAVNGQCVTIGVPTPADDYSRVTYKNETINVRTKQMLKVAEGFYGSDNYYLGQGSYNPGGVAASGTTHDGGGALDIGGSSLSPKEEQRMVESLRKAGFAAWLRTPNQGRWSTHIHAIAIGDKEMSAGAASQVKDYFNGKDGLSGSSPDTHPDIGRPIPEWALEFGAPKCPK